ncbi:cytochrome c oxidase subunit 3 [Hydrocarboniphaga sp.]|uniref:cytochrome c oxidase subunit 3 n=1 Tax=Hydrocarboniphaga sp. TaxID=2033016 RepID=UPI003D0DB05D
MIERIAAAGRARRLPGIEGVWVFIAADLAIFGLLFVSFALDRQEQATLFEHYRRRLDANFGGINTLILLSSSYLVALAVQAAKADQRRRVARYLAGSLLCGFAFGVSKIVEYRREISAGFSPATNDFLMYYFTLTGIHLMHVIAGCVVLSVLLKNARRQAYGRDSLCGLETGVSYWHMVDLLWLLIFPLLYLMR